MTSPDAGAAGAPVDHHRPTVYARPLLLQGRASPGETHAPRCRGRPGLLALRLLNHHGHHPGSHRPRPRRVRRRGCPHPGALPERRRAAPARTRTGRRGAPGDAPGDAVGRENSVRVAAAPCAIMVPCRPGCRSSSARCAPRSVAARRSCSRTCSCGSSSPSPCALAPARGSGGATGCSGCWPAACARTGAGTSCWCGRRRCSAGTGRGWRLFWWWRSGRPTGRPRVPQEVRDLIRRLSEENRLWGTERIRGELLKLGIAVSNGSIRRYRWRARAAAAEPDLAHVPAQPRARRSGRPTSSPCPPLTFRTLYVLFFITHDRRELVHVRVTAHPTAAWVWRQLHRGDGVGPPAEVPAAGSRCGLRPRLRRRGARRWGSTPC